MGDELYIRNLIMDLPDYPKKGIVFRDITPVLKDPDAFRRVIKNMKDVFKKEKIDAVVSVESRGFIFGAALAYELGASFIPVRKPGKLPRETIHAEYDLEYGRDRLEMHKDAITPGQKVLIVDDLLATGGTAGAVASLVKSLGGEVAGLAVMIELLYCKGREKIPAGINVYSIVKYE